MGRRTYDQYCPVAAALDLLGDRWTLLVIRELLLGPKRYRDLERALPGISPNLLSERLRHLEDAGLTTREDLEPPAACTVYRLTDEGRAARDVVGALARFGATHLPAPKRATKVRPAMAVYATLIPFLDRQVAAGVDDHYRLVLNGRSFDVAVTAGGTSEPHPESRPDLVLECDPALLVAARQGRTNLADAADRGRVRVEGTPAALDRFLSVFALPGRPE